MKSDFVSKRLKWAGIASAIAAKSSKLLQVLKLVKVAKPLLMFVSLSISAVAYAFTMGPWLAILFVTLLLIHEMGHVIAMRLKGLPTSTPVFIPFLGAAVFAPEFETRSEEAFVGYGGPLLGSIAALMVFCLYLAMPNSPAAPILLTGSFLGVFLNLFNLIPVSPLDGGRVMQSVSRFSRYIGILILGAVSLLLKTPVILMIWILLLSDMEILSRKLKAVLGSVFYVGMVSMMALGLSQQALWIDITDCVTAGIFTGGYIFAAFALKNHPIKEDQRALAAPEERLKWLGLYLGLASVLVIVIIVQQHYLQSMLVK